MPINTNLSTAPYFDDFDIENQYYRVLFKPSYAVQARELTQLQTSLQNQIEQFGDNIYKEGSIIKGCNFTELADLNYVKLADKGGFDPTVYVGFDDTVTVGGQEYVRDNSFELRGAVSGVKARVVAAARGFQTRDPDLNTFFINYTSTSSGNKVFQAGERLDIYKISSYDIGTTTSVSESLEESINVTNFPNPVGNSFGLRSAPGIIFQKGHFLFAEEQLIVISKYSNTPNNISIGYVVEERLITALQDPSLYDNANGSANENAPGADRLKLIPILTSLPTSEADSDTTFFTLSRYSNGRAVTLRDVSQYNALGEEMARRTYEESGDYIVRDFKTTVVRRNDELKASVGSGLGYVKGYRVENLAEILLDIDPIANTSIDIRNNQAVSFNYGGYLNVVNGANSGVLPIDDFSTVNLQNGSSSNIGTARVRNVTDDKVFLFDIRMTGSNELSSVEGIVGSSGKIVIDSSSVVNESTKSSMIFDTGAISLKSTEDISLPVREKRELTGLSGTSVVISPAVGEDFNVDNNDILFVEASNQKIEVTDVSVSQLTGDMTLQLAGTTSASATVYINKRIVDARPFTKAVAELYVKCTFASADASSPSKFNLGFPDVYEIVSITDSGGNDVTTSFRFRTNQKDNYYDHSYIEFIPGRTIPADGAMTVRMKAFKLNDTTGDYFFTIDSYPIGTGANEVPANKIHPYTSPAGKTYSLRDSLDFRPLVEPISGANYTNAAAEGTAPTVSSSSTSVSVAPTFSSSYTILTPAHDTFAQLDYEFYLNRTDSVTIDTFGRTALIKGKESENSVPPSITSDQIKIADIFIPGVPALTPEEAYAQNRQSYGVKVTTKGIKSYRMKDIENIERKVDSLRYYVLLTTLETETKNLNILDENGLSRFKNGIIVDPFNDLNIANIESAEFNAAIDFTEKSLMPAVKSFPLNLKYKSNTNGTIFPSTSNAKIGTLSRDSDVSIINQPYASEFRNCVSNFWSYKGEASIDPEYDTFYDVTTNPVNVTIDTATATRQLAESLNEILPQTATSSEVISSNVERAVATTGNTRTTTTTTTDLIRDTFRRLNVTESTTERKVGDFVSNIEFNNFMAPREIKVYMSGLRPNTQHYFFFDGIDVNEFVAPGDDVDNAESVHRNGVFGAAVSTNSSGVLTAIFAIPAQTFFVGDRKLEIVDVDTYGTIDSASTSYGFAFYRAYNFDIEKSALTISTRTASTSVSTTTSERNVSRRSVSSENIAPPRRERDEGDSDARRDFSDPIAQTFFVKAGMGQGSDTIFASKIDLYFKRKSSEYGVTVELREVINGYPSYQVIPFSKVHLTSAEVNVSDDASVATTITFPAPIRLDIEKEYAFAVMPDASNPDYLIFTSKIGGNDLTPGDNQGKSIVQDWGDGVLFTSTNNRAWKSYQDEDIKFNLYRHNFNSSTGTITLTNDDHEFITTQNNIGRFNAGEIVYTTHSVASGSEIIGLTAGSNEISGTNLSSVYSTDDYIVAFDGASNKQLFKVVSANSSIIVADRPASFTASINANPVTIGTLKHYDFRYPNFMILEGSSANSTEKFEAADTIYGFDSGSTATISSIDDIEFSYIQPMIMRTNDSASFTTLSGTFVDPNVTTNTYTQAMEFNDKTLFSKNGMVVFSKSNDINRTKSMDLIVDLGNSNNVTSSPFIDIETSSVMAYQWKITNSSETTAKYVSQTVELAENLDAEDFQIYVTGYRPNGTDIKIYIRPQAANDPEVFEVNDWIELELWQGVNLYSSINNRYDFKEFVYRVPDTAKSNGALQYSNDIGTFTGYRRFAVKIELLSENIFKAPRLLDYRGISLT